ncbi:unnamed protein product [Arabidopsis arenosa]|uniref:CBF1-interacting co-repressor CIR N-terminal domain-containing protein n=1 Tax=Arabidopsis arenosa TaxID=38785 RepID=A0A8S2A8T8_ARAAE|nr:unnamed protein product [Arabidopsis arenosa]
MGMKFLNKKGWHTGSLRNIETVWKAEQKQEAEQKKLEELRLQILQERERSEFRALQEQAGLIPRQERLEFLYDSGLAVGKGSASGSGVSFQKEEQPLAKAEAGNSASEKPDQSAPGALFEEKAQSANDSWRKLHSDPLLLIRQREQEALAKIKNNPVKMALIRKSVEEKGKGKDGDTKEHKKKHKRKSGKHQKQSSSRRRSDSEEDSGEEYNGRKSHHQKTSGTHDKHYERPSYGQEDKKRKTEDLDNGKHPSRENEYQNRRRKGGSKLSEEERAARLKQMQMDAEVHEEQRWKRLKKADETDAVEADKNKVTTGKSFLDDANKSVYGIEKGGSSTIEESVRRRSYYSQRGTAAEGNAFRR